MKKLLIFFAFLYCIPTFAQDSTWAPIGATWYYDMPQGWLYPPFGMAYMKYESLRDTTINGKACRIIKKTGHSQKSSSYVNLFITYSDSNRIYLWKDPLFKLVYDFGAKTGDTLYMAYTWDNPDDTILYTVDSISHIFIGSDSFKVFHVNPLPNYHVGSSLWGNIIEGIGSMGNLFYDIPSDVDPIPGGFRCYIDSNINYSPYYLACDTTWSSIYQNTHNNESSIDIYPALISQKVWVEIKKSHHSIQITLTNIMGQIIYEKCLYKKGEYSIDVSLLSAGLYFLQANSDNAFQINKRLIKY